MQQAFTFDSDGFETCFNKARLSRDAYFLFICVSAIAGAIVPPCILMPRVSRLLFFFFFFVKNNFRGTSHVSILISALMLHTETKKRKRQERDKNEEEAGLRVKGGSIERVSYPRGALFSTFNCVTRLLFFARSNSLPFAVPL